jgi:acyl transferase domain-containing protein/thioesterase domain-containing protein
MAPLEFNTQPDALDVAVIGMSGRFPKAKNVNDFWQNIQNGVEAISFFSTEELSSLGIDSDTLSSPNYVKAASFLEDAEMFDASFFGYNPREAQIMDPQHRIFMECAWEALENAGYDAETYKGLIGVYAGQSINTYLLYNLFPNRELMRSVGDFQILIGNDKDYLTTHVSYKLNLTGPSVVVQTACSTSLVAIHLARQSLLTGECDMALAGGVSVRVPQKAGYFYHDGGVTSPDGHCRAFDSTAKGTIFGSGAGIVVLKRLADAIADGDYIYAVIKGSAINNDGCAKIGYTAPSIQGQSQVIIEALANAGVEADTINYVEAHGTGTPLGDPIEVAALTQAFRSMNENDAKIFCGLGSLKTNIGHLDAAAGVAGFIKTVLSLHHKLIPPSLHFEQPNPKIDFTNSSFYVNTQLSEWKRSVTPRRAGVNSLGIGGTNAHVILEEAPKFYSSKISRPWHLLLLSTKTSTALKTATKNLVEHLKQHSNVNLADVTYTLQVGRKAFKYRQMLVCQDIDDAIKALEAMNSERVLTNFEEPKDRSVVFMFSGQGTQYVNMASELYQFEPLFKKQIDICAELLQPHLGLDIREILYPSDEQIETATERLTQTLLTQPILFVVEYALAKLWMEWGVNPQAMIGHSVGEYVAACLAGVFSLEDALMLIATRGKLMQSLPSGSMVAVPLSEKKLQPFLSEELSLAAVNGVSLCVASGSTEAIKNLQIKLSEKNVTFRALHTSHAFHSKMMEPILDAFVEEVKNVTLTPPKIPYISNVTGTWITASQATDPHYWSKHLRGTVQFANGLHELLKESNQILLEIGPGWTLSKLTKQHPSKTSGQIVLSSLSHAQNKQSDFAFLLNTLGQLWLAGIQIDWASFHAHDPQQRIPLPTYPFEGQRYWIEAHQLPEVSHANTKVDEKLPVTDLGDDLYFSLQQELNRLNNYVSPTNEIEQSLVNIWQDLIGIQSIGIHDNFFEVGGHSLLATQMIVRLQEIFTVELSISHLIERSTIAELAKVIEEMLIQKQEQLLEDEAQQLAHQQSASPSWSPLVSIQPNGSKRPFFCVHPIGGYVLNYIHLARCLDPEQPFYGLQAKGLDGKNEPFTQVEEMAASYIEAMCAVQPEGPYLLGGWSMGGIVAFEMAIQLQRRGHEVALLAVIDSALPNYINKSYQDKFDEILTLKYFALTLGSSIGKNLSVSYDTLKHLSRDEQMNYILEQAKMNAIIPSDVGLTQIRPLIKVFTANVQAVLKYVPQFYPKQVILFLAQDMLKELSDLHDPKLGWNDLTAKPVEIYTIPGNHYTMMAKPYVQNLAEQLSCCLEKAQNTCPKIYKPV